MLPFKLIYSDKFYLPIGAHVFPAQKYRLIYQRLLESKIATAEDFIEPQAAADEDILLVHTPEYLRKLKNGTLSRQEELQMEIPYSPELVEVCWLSAGGSILAAEHALRDGVAFNIAGGFHHAFPDHGEGFCVIHDVAVAIRRMQKDGKIRHAMTVDCDVHQGNGTAAIFSSAHAGSAHAGAAPAGMGGLPSAFFAPSRGAQSLKSGGIKSESDTGGDVFTISLHQQNNYPAIKPPSSIDVNLADGVGDDDYLHWLDNALSSGLRQFTPELICYVAGADPYREDQLGGLSLSIEGLKKRDELVFRVARARHIPVMVTYAGGYAHQVEDTVTIHCNTVVAAKEMF
ncbi:MAG TPA: histone deacetylase [Terriglobales bacterium]|nr:histone deacetylase [Terriglobales bacterium]